VPVLFLRGKREGVGLDLFASNQRVFLAAIVVDLLL